MTAVTERRSIRRGAMLATALAFGLVCNGRAHADGAPVDIQIVDRNTGQPLQVWRHDGRLFVAGAPGDRYGLRVVNHTDRRVLVVMSVDGVNILSGETAGYDQRGYIFRPHESYEVDGWRKSLTEVADFTFTRLSQSYAALTGRPQNVGVIGYAVFYERAAPVAEAPPPPPAPATIAPSRAGTDERSEVTEMTVTAQKRSPPSRSAPAAVSAYTGAARDIAEAQPRDERLGTGHGDREESVMTLEPFERETPYPQFTEEIAYDTRDHLVAMGVIPVWHGGPPRSQPFPASPPDAGFAPDPPGD